MIPPFVQQVLGVVVRAAIVWVAGYLAAHGFTISDDQTTQVVAWATPLLAALAWSIYQKFHGRQKLLTAAASNQVLTEQEVEAMVKNPLVNTPSVNTAKDQVPA